MKAQDLVRIVEERAPASLAASWDNPGWQVGDPHAAVRAVLVALDPAEAVVREAQDRGCNLVVTHHPLLFHPLRTLDPTSPVGARVAQLVRQEIGLWSAHTNLDCVPDGVSGALAEALGLVPDSLRLLVPFDQGVYRLEVFVPESLTDEAKERLVVASRPARLWETAVNGYAGPDFLEETGLVGLVPADRLAAVRAALRDLGPAVSVNLTPLVHHRGPLGWGAVGELPTPLTTDDLLRRVRDRLGAPIMRLVPGAHGTHRTVAVCGGSGGRFVPDAARSATAYVAGECDYHEAQEAQMLGLTVIEAGHYHTERPVVDRLAAWLRARANVPVHVSEVDTSPFADSGASHLSREAP